MEVITGHYGTDFDCLGAMIGAKKLHPRAVIILPGRMDRNVRGFLDQYEEEFHLRQPRDVDLTDVDRVIVCDNRRAQRLGKPLSDIVLNDGVEIVVYDHHPPAEDDLPSAECYIREVGATCTIITGEIRDRELRITPVEATALALGIYEDTGSLSFSSTTVEDVLAVAFLLQAGADLEVVSRHIRYSLTEEQREVLNQFVLSVEHRTFSGVKIAVASAVVDDYIGDVAVLTHKLAVIESVDALFTLTQAKDNVYVVGRSRSDSLDVAAVVGYLGGGGHHRAASAVLKRRPIAEVRAALFEHISDCVRPPLVARDIMSYPVRMIESTTTVDEAKRVLLRYGYAGILVTENGTVVGHVALKELDRALHHDLGHAPVKSCMHTRVVFATPDTPAPELQDMLIAHRVGRVPIVDEDQNIIGIVTRSDLRQGTHLPSNGEHRVYLGEFGGTEDVSAILKTRRRDGLTPLLQRLGRIADELGRPAFLVGGGARDLLLDAESVDVDILVEGDGIAFARRAVQDLGARLLTHGKFGTAVMLLPDGGKIDVASARTEFYEAPAALPTVEVEHSSVKEDLYRRDFTINAMAVRINADHFGRLYDFFGGRADLERGVIRVLHSLSFVEDPTRVFRAIRFEQRLGFRLEEQTEALLEYALEAELFEALATDRIRDELRIILSERDPIPAIHRLAHLGVWPHVHERIAFGQEALDELHRTSEMLRWLGQIDPPPEPQRWLAYLCPLLREMTGTEVRDLARRLRFQRDALEDLSQAVDATEFVLAALESEQKVRPSHVYQLLEPLSDLLLTRVLVCSAPGGSAERRIIRYLTETRAVSLTVGGKDLKELGCKPGPIFGMILRRLLAERLDGEISAEDEPRRLRELAEAMHREHGGKGTPHAVEGH